MEGEKSVSALLYRKRVEAADTKRQVTHKSEEEKPWREKKRAQKYKIKKDADTAPAGRRTSWQLQPANAAAEKKKGRSGKKRFA